VVIYQAINMEFTHTPARLQWFITATGIIYFAFAYFVPTISAMRNWLATSAALTLAYDVALLAILIRDGNRAPPLISSTRPVSLCCCDLRLNPLFEYRPTGGQITSSAVVSR
jgi:hypothetical protein